MFVCLRREVLRRHGWYIAVEPIYDPYRDDPRLAELLEIAGFAPVARSARAPRAEGSQPSRTAGSSL